MREPFHHQPGSLLGDAGSAAGVESRALRGGGSPGVAREEREETGPEAREAKENSVQENQQ